MAGRKLLAHSGGLPVARRHAITRTYAFAPNSSVERKSTKVLFTIKQRVEFGKQIAVVGSTPSLGSWDPTAGLTLQWREGDTWQSEALIEAVDEDVELKFVIKDEEKVFEWQPGRNITLHITDPDASTISVEATWAEDGAVVRKVPVAEDKDSNVTVTAEKAPQAPQDVEEGFALSQHPNLPLTANEMPLSSSQLKRLTVPKLKALATHLGLPNDGKKADLVSRLSVAMDKVSRDKEQSISQQ